MTQTREDRLTQIARSWGIQPLGPVVGSGIYTVAESDLFRLLESYSFADAGAFPPPASLDNLRSKNHELSSMVAELTEKLQAASEAEARAQKEAQQIAAKYHDLYSDLTAPVVVKNRELSREEIADLEKLNTYGFQLSGTQGTAVLSRGEAQAVIASSKSIRVVPLEDLRAGIARLPERPKSEPLAFLDVDLLADDAE